MNRNQIVTTALAALITIPSLSGCDASLLSDVKELDKIVSVSAASVQKTYDGVNDFCRQAYLTRRKFDPTLRVKHRHSQEEDPDEGVNSLVYQYSPEDLQARKLTLQGLIEYCAGLAAIAGSDSPAEAGQAAAQLGERLATTADTLTKLKEAHQKKAGTKKDALKFEQYSKPISILAKLAAETWVKKVQKDSLKQCITEGYKTTEEAFDLLENDLDNMYDSAFKENAELTLIAEEMYYNNKFVLKSDNPGVIPASGSAEHKAYFDAVSDKARLDTLNEIGVSAKSFAAICDASPKPLIQTMRTAHQRLFKYVKENSKNSDGLFANMKGDENLELRIRTRGVVASVVESFRTVKNAVETK